MKTKKIQIIKLAIITPLLAVFSFFKEDETNTTNKKVLPKDLVSNNKDVSFIFLADHGHKDAKYFNIEEHQDFYNTLRIDHFSIEPRACAFFVKEGLEERFKELATKYYGEHFYILSKEEVIKNNVFGLGKENERFRYCIGDFLLVSKDEWAFNQGEEEGLKSHHAGSSKEEIEISLAWFN